jgi:hypothetical protein
MFRDLLGYMRMLRPIVEFEDPADLIRQLEDKVATPAERRQ